VAATVRSRWKHCNSLRGKMICFKLSRVWKRGCSKKAPIMWALFAVTALLACTIDGQGGWGDGPLLVEVMGDEYQWYVTYAGADGELHTSDDIVDTTDVHVPVGVDVQLKLRSKDFVYLLALPDLKVKQIAVPDLEFDLDFQFDVIGTYKLAGNQLCGFRHESLMGTVFVQSKDQFKSWLHGRSGKSN